MTPLHQRERPRNKLLRCERNDQYVVGAAFERLEAKFRKHVIVRRDPTPGRIRRSVHGGVVPPAWLLV